MEGEVNLMWRIWLLECVCWFCCGASLSFCHLQSLLFSNKAVFLLLCASPSFCLAFCVRSLVQWGSTAASLRQHTDDLIALDFWCLLLSDLPHGYFWTVVCPQIPWWHCARQACEGLACASCPTAFIRSAFPQEQPFTKFCSLCLYIMVTPLRVPRL